MNIEEKIRQYLDNSAGVNQWLCVLRKFKQVVGEKESYDSWDVLKFLRECERKYKYKPNSLATYIRILKRIYELAGWEWDKTRIRTPKVDSMEISKPRLPEESVEKMINNSDRLNVYMRGLLFLSTIYGLRRVELSTIRKEDIDLEGKKILIRTAKGGDKRWMRLPEAGCVILEDWEPKDIDERNRGYLNVCFQAITFVTLGKIFRGHGWHDIRRELAVRLSPPHTSLSDYEIIQFMRWSTGFGSSIQILQEYRKSAGEPEKFEIDERVLEQHPFLKEWEKLYMRGP